MSYGPLSHSRHNAKDRSTKVVHEINSIFLSSLTLDDIILDETTSVTAKTVQVYYNALLTADNTKRAARHFNAKLHVYGLVFIHFVRFYNKFFFKF